MRRKAFLSHLFKCEAGSLRFFLSFPLMLNLSSTRDGRGDAQQALKPYHYQFVCDRAPLLPWRKIQAWSGGRSQGWKQHGGRAGDTRSGASQAIHLLSLGACGRDFPLPGLHHKHHHQSAGWRLGKHAPLNVEG